MPGYALDRMRAARERAECAARTAAWHELLAITDSAAIRALHEQLAAMHRRTELRHGVTADMYRSLAAQLGLAPAGQAGLATAPSLLSATADLAGADGAIIALFDARHAEILSLASDPAARRAYEIEFTTGEGPSLETARTRRLVTVSAADLGGRWPLYGPQVARLDVGAVAAVPLEAGGVCLGALTLLNPGSQRVGAVIGVLGEALAHSLLDGTPRGYLAASGLPAHGDHRAAVHRAAGIVSARHGCSVDDALALIRARAFAGGTDAGTVADGVLRDRQSLD